MRTLLLLLVLLLALPFTCAVSLADQLFIDFFPELSQSAIAVVPPSILFAQTPIVVRYTLMGGIAIYEPQAACHPTALSFFGTRDKVPASLCDPDSVATIYSYAIYRAILREFPTEAAGYAKFLISLGLTPFSTSTDLTTANGWGNFFGNRIADFFQDDGWNSLGDAVPGQKLDQFQDYTDYAPQNPAKANRTNLPRPLRWQPFLMPKGNGDFVSQVHIVPQIATRNVKTLVITRKQARERRASSPFKTPNRKNTISPGDKRTARTLLREVIQISGSLTPEQRFFARWWDNKLLSTATISGYYEEAAKLTRFEVAQQFMGEMMAQYDALVITWREKRRWDQARPRTVLPNVFPGKEFRAFVPDKNDFRRVTAEDWAPLIPEQPHSEFPSGSAALCTAALEHIQVYTEWKVGRRVPPIKFRIPNGTLPFPQAGDRTVAFDDPAEAAAVCGESRLWAGVHFRPAVDAGFVVGRGIGKIVFEHIRLLGEGTVPARCMHCVKGKRRMSRSGSSPSLGGWSYIGHEEEDGLEHD